MSRDDPNRSSVPGIDPGPEAEGGDFIAVHGCSAAWFTGIVSLESRDLAPCQYARAHPSTM
jgi:hypothetical protein